MQQVLFFLKSQNTLEVDLMYCLCDRHFQLSTQHFLAVEQNLTYRCHLSQNT
jgi:hypothetical protein